MSSPIINTAFLSGTDNHGFFIVTTPGRACSLTLPCSMERRVYVV